MLYTNNLVYYKDNREHTGIIRDIKTVNNMPLYMVEWDDAETLKNHKKMTIGYREKDLVKVKV